MSAMYESEEWHFAAMHTMRDIVRAEAANEIDHEFARQAAAIRVALDENASRPPVWTRAQLKRMADTLAALKCAAKAVGLELKRECGDDEHGYYFHGFTCGSFGLVVEDGTIRMERYRYISGTFFEPPSTDADYTGDVWENNPDNWRGAVERLLTAAHDENLERALECGGDLQYARFARRSAHDAAAYWENKQD